MLAAIVPKLFGARVLAFMQEPAPELAEVLGQGKRTVKMLKRLEQLTLRFADGAIAVTEDLRGRFIERGADGRRIAVVLNCSTSEAVTTAHAGTQPDDGAVVLICHGTVEPRWGHDDILQALAIARARVPQLRLVLTGMGTGVDAVLALRDRLDLHDIVSWEGWVTEERLGELLKSSHIGIVAQKSSDYSNLVQTTKMYDYWAVGLPVIASRLHATAAVFNDSEIAYYRPDDASDLAEQLVRLGNDPHLREAYAAAGRSAYQRFGWHVQREIYLDAVQHVLTDRRLAADNLEQAGVPQ